MKWFFTLYSLWLSCKETWCLLSFTLFNCLMGLSLVVLLVYFSVYRDQVVLEIDFYYYDSYLLLVILISFYYLFIFSLRKKKLTHQNCTNLVWRRYFGLDLKCNCVVTSSSFLLFLFMVPFCLIDDFLCPPPNHNKRSFYNFRKKTVLYYSPYKL